MEGLCREVTDHIAGDEAGPAARLAPVESVRVLLADDLDELALAEGQLLVARVGVRRHGRRLVVEQGHEDPAWHRRRVENEYRVSHPIRGFSA